MFRTFTAAAIITLSITTVTAAQAGTVTVNLRGLDLSDRQAVSQRVALAADEACGPAASPLDNRPSMQAEATSDHRACVRTASRQAMTGIDQLQVRLAKAQAAVKLAAN